MFTYYFGWSTSSEQIKAQYCWWSRYKITKNNILSLNITYFCCVVLLWSKTERFASTFFFHHLLLFVCQIKTKKNLFKHRSANEEIICVSQDLQLTYLLIQRNDSDAEKRLLYIALKNMQIFIVTYELITYFCFSNFDNFFVCVFLLSSKISLILLRVYASLSSRYEEAIFTKQKTFFCERKFQILDFCFVSKYAVKAEKEHSLGSSSRKRREKRLNKYCRNST